MSIFSIKNVKIEAVCAAVPVDKNVISDYEIMTEQEKKIFSQGTGIFERRFSKPGLCASDLCFHSAQKIIDTLTIDKEEISIIVFVSQSPDYYLPATSVLLQERLGLSKNVIAFDVNLGCSGYVYGLSIIANFLSLPGFKKGILMCGDVSSTSLNYLDKSTYPLFGDAGSATLLSGGAEGFDMHFNLQTDGSGKEAIIIKNGGTRNPIIKEDTLTETENGKKLVLNGLDVFNFALKEVKPNLNSLFNYCNASESTIDYLVMHQANLLINETVRKKMAFPPEKVPYSLAKYGNTSSASIPLTITTELKEKLNGDKKLLLSGFGVGFSWGSVLLNTRDIKIIDLIEI